MSTVREFPIVAPFSKQKCPLCSEEKIIIANGLFRNDKQMATFPDRGFSFCNCKSIWFTDWDNIDLVSRHENESVEVLQHYLYRWKIFNRGYQKNMFMCLGDAPKTEAEFRRLGFAKATGDLDIIWAYHIFEHMHYPVKELKHYYDLLSKEGILFIAMPDPYFIDFDDVYGWEHWLLREHYIMWDMDSFCEKAEEIGFTVKQKNRNTDVRVCKDMHLILQK